MSTLKVTTIQNLSGTEVYTAKAWVNFNGTGTVAIRASGNVSSITDNGTADYTVNFTVAMSDANYAAIGMNSAQVYTSVKTGTTPTTSAVSLVIGGVSDASYMYVAIFR